MLSLSRPSLWTDPYEVQLEVFEGPMDLLLYLIRKNEIDIYDIPIAYITEEYLRYVSVIQELDINGAGDFLVMAATLMWIKARSLLPSPQDEEAAEEDPRRELVQRLLEYQQYKAISKELEKREWAQREVFHRCVRPVEDAEKESEVGGDVSLFDLVRAFWAVMGKIPKFVPHEIERIQISVEERIAFILESLEGRDRILFVNLVAGESRRMLVVTFMALLELIRLQRVMARQSAWDKDIWIYRR